MKDGKIRGKCIVTGAVLFTFFMTAAGGKTPYGTVSPGDYLAGRFRPEENKLFVELSSTGVPTGGRKLYMRRETAAALVRMYADMKKALPGRVFYVRSATRTFLDQKTIWEDKWYGRTQVGGKRLDLAYKDPAGRAKKILEYSSMPGTSRHHWGTDFDINELDNRYYEGEGHAVYTWLIANARGYGFCRPYNEGRQGGYREEKWHWSYLPLAGRFLEDWKRMYGEDPAWISAKGLFAGSDTAGRMAITYVATVNDDCAGAGGQH